MQEIEIYQDLLNKTKDVKIEKRKCMFNISDLCFLLSFLQVSSLTLQEVDFENHKDEFKEIFENYYPRQILHNGQYLAQLNRVLDHFKPKNPSPYKKLTQAVFLTARFFGRYDSFEAFRKEVYLSCVDEASTLSYLVNFRKLSSLSSIYFLKTCMFFEKSGLLDIPLVTKKAKEYLLPLFGIEDENEALYKKMISLCRKNNITCHELNDRIEALNQHD